MNEGMVREKGGRDARLGPRFDQPNRGITKDWLPEREICPETSIRSEGRQKAASKGPVMQRRFIEDRFHNQKP